MASSIAVLTRKVTRNKLAQFLTNQELIKAFEDLTQDVGTTLPNAIGTNADAIAESQATADSAVAATRAVQAIAEYVRALVETMPGGPPPVPSPDDLDSRILGLIPPFPTKADLGLGNVENTALSTWPGSTNITTLGTVTTGTWNATPIAPLYGGTGLTSYAIGDLIYASGVATLSRLADVATGSALLAGGIGVAPSWGKIGSSVLDLTMSPTWTGNHTFAPSSGNTQISNGHLGIGVAPSTWSTGRAVEVGSAGNAFWAYGGTAYLTQGVNYNGGFKYATASSPVNAFAAQSGSFYWYTAPAGTLGNSVSFTTAMLLDANGNLGIALTPGGSYKLEVGGALSVSSTTMIRTATAFSNGAGAAGGTLTNAPAAGNPTKWVPINDAGITRYIPSW